MSAVEQINQLWDIWSTRIIVTAAILIVWEYFFKSKDPARHISNAPTVLQYDDQPLESTPRHRSRLLDELEEVTKTSVSKANTEASKLDERNDVPEVVSESRKEDKPKKRKGDAKKTKESVVSTSTTISSSHDPPPIKATSNHHPGMSAFGYWYEVETSLFRIYTLGRNDGVEVVPPYIPHSYRGNVSVHLHVTNSTNLHLNVYWVDYKGKHVLKGSMRPNQRVIPTLPESNTMTEDGVGQHKFAIVAPKPNTPFYVGVKDEIFPFPAEHNFHEPLAAITWTLQHMTRMNYLPDDPSLDTLQKYLSNIFEHPEDAKYRQLRIRSPKFSPIWSSAMRGLLLAVGFVEEEAYAELGCANKPLSRERVQEVALLSYLIDQWRLKQRNSFNPWAQQQPEGADGYGRAGFGRAGTIN